MNEKDFLIYFNSKSTTDNFTEEYFDELCGTLKNYLDADKVDYKFSKRKEDKLLNGLLQKEESDWHFSVCNGAFQVTINNIRKSLDDEIFFKNMIESIFSNVFKNYIIIERVKKEQKMDKMLGVLNRNAYEELCGNSLELINTGISFLDVNGLGIINNKYGYDAGDLMLKTVSNFLLNEFRYDDIYRIGGDEFVVICQNISKDLFMEKIANVMINMSTENYNASCGTVYKEKIVDIKDDIKYASELMKDQKELYRKMHPDLYISKYAVTRSKK